MRAAQWITCCWPGLSGLWLQGRWSGLVTAIGFAVLLNVAMASQFLWVQVVSQQGLAILWAIAFLAWCGGFWQAARHVYRLPPRPLRQGEVDLFIQAQGEYLRGHWFEAEAILERLVNSNPQDVDAHLMLAGLYRHTKRRVEATERLRQLKQIDGAAKWQLEVRQEFELLQRLDATPEPPATANQTAAEASVDQERAPIQQDSIQQDLGQGDTQGSTTPEPGAKKGIEYIVDTDGMDTDVMDTDENDSQIEAA